ncbi:hypothetical protein FQR65_LT15441 [Abscondita terminalis]|nr:hypothetical protein FQR65_LT15441 [Abscondita terminalis]
MQLLRNFITRPSVAKDGLKMSSCKIQPNCFSCAFEPIFQFTGLVGFPVLSFQCHHKNKNDQISFSTRNIVSLILMILFLTGANFYFLYNVWASDDPLTILPTVPVYLLLSRYIATLTVALCKSRFSKIAVIGMDAVIKYWRQLTDEDLLSEKIIAQVHSVSLKMIIFALSAPTFVIVSACFTSFNRNVQLLQVVVCGIGLYADTLMTFGFEMLFNALFNIMTQQQFHVKHYLEQYLFKKNHNFSFKQYVCFSSRLIISNVWIFRNLEKFVNLICVLCVIFVTAIVVINDYIALTILLDGDVYPPGLIAIQLQTIIAICLAWRTMVAIDKIGKMDTIKEWEILTGEKIIASTQLKNLQTRLLTYVAIAFSIGVFCLSSNFKTSPQYLKAIEAVNFYIESVVFFGYIIIFDLFCVMYQEFYSLLQTFLEENQSNISDRTVLIGRYNYSFNALFYGSIKSHNPCTLVWVLLTILILILKTFCLIVRIMNHISIYSPILIAHEYSSFVFLIAAMYKVEKLHSVYTGVVGFPALSFQCHHKDKVDNISSSTRNVVLLIFVILFLTGANFYFLYNVWTNYDVEADPITVLPTVSVCLLLFRKMAVIAMDAVVKNWKMLADEDLLPQKIITDIHLHCLKLITFALLAPTFVIISACFISFETNIQFAQLVVCGVGFYVDVLATFGCEMLFNALLKIMSQHHAYVKHYLERHLFIKTDIRSSFKRYMNFSTRMHISNVWIFRNLEIFLNPTCVLCIIFTTAIVVVNAYITLTISLDGDTFPPGLIAIQLQTLTSICLLWRTVGAIDNISKVSDDILSFLFKYPISKLSVSEASQIEMLIKTIVYQKPVLRASDIFVVSTKLLASVSGTIVTYVLVALQFHSAWTKS